MASTRQIAKRLERLFSFMPGAFRDKKNFGAVMGAIAESDADIEQLFLEVRKQLFIETAQDEYLNMLGANLGVNRPPLTGMVDEDFREFIKLQTYYPKQIKQLLFRMMELFYGRDTIKANIRTSVPGNYQVFDGANLKINVDGLYDLEVVFYESDFNNPQSVSAEEIAAQINSKLDNVVFAATYRNAIDKQTYLELFTDTFGPVGSISVTGGSANRFLKFPSTLRLGTTIASQYRFVKQNTSMKLYWAGGDNPLFSQLRSGDSVLITGSSFPSNNVGSFAVESIIDTGVPAVKLPASSAVLQSPNVVRYEMPTTVNVLQGNQVTVSGFTNPSNNGTFLVLSTSSGYIDVASFRTTSADDETSVGSIAYSYTAQNALYGSSSASDELGCRYIPSSTFTLSMINIPNMQTFGTSSTATIGIKIYQDSVISGTPAPASLLATSLNTVAFNSANGSQTFSFAPVTLNAGTPYLVMVYYANGTGIGYNGGAGPYVLWGFDSSVSLPENQYVYNGNGSWSAPGYIAMNFTASAASTGPSPFLVDLLPSASHIVYTNENGSSTDTVSVSTVDDVLFFRPEKRKLESAKRPATVWEVTSNEIVIILPATPVVVRRGLSGSSHVQGTSAIINKSFSNKVDLINPEFFPAYSGSFWLQKPNGHVVRDKTYTYSVKANESLLNVTPPITPIGSKLRLGVGPLSTESGSSLVTVTCVEPHNLSSGELVRFANFEAFNGLTEEAINSTFSVVTVVDSVTFTVNTAGTAASSGSNSPSVDKGEIFTAKGSKVVITNVQQNTGYVSAYIYDEKNALYTISDMQTTLSEDILIGDFGNSISVFNSGVFSDNSGEVIFSYGKTDEEGPVKYIARPSSTRIFIDPSYRFKKSHKPGAPINLMRSPFPTEVAATGKQYPVYIVDTISPREKLKELLLDAKAAGVSIRFIVVLPDNVYNAFDLYA